MKKIVVGLVIGGGVILIAGLFWMVSNTSYILGRVFEIVGVEQGAPEKHHVPGEYAGWASVTYNVPGSPELPLRDGAVIFEYDQNGVLVTSSPRNDGVKRQEFFSVEDGNAMKLFQAGRGEELLLGNPPPEEKRVWHYYTATEFVDNGEPMGKQMTGFFIGTKQQYEDEDTPRLLQLPLPDLGVLTEAWLGQKTPGSTPRPFAPGTVSTDENVEFTIAFSSDAKEIYFTRREPEGHNRILVTRFIHGHLTDPVVAEFTEGESSSHPFITADGERMIFGWRARGGGSGWVADRNGDSWGVPVILGESIMRASATEDGTIYFSDNSAGTIADSFIASIDGLGSDKEDRKPVVFEKTDLTNFVHPWVSPDGRFMIFDSWEAPDGYGNADLYVSYRKDDGRWSSPRNLGDTINTEALEMTATLSPDGRFLFFVREDSIFWVEAPDLLDEMPARAE